MTPVAFHFNAPDRLAYVCRLLRKAVSSGSKIVVLGQLDVLQQLDTDLWTFSAVDFVPHCHLSSDPGVVAATPVILTPSTQKTPHQEVLINLDQVIPENFEQFERVIEVVGLEDQDRQLARGRWKHYAAQGYAIQRHDLVLKT